VLLFGGFIVVFFVARNRRLRAAALINEPSALTEKDQDNKVTNALTPEERDRLNRLLQQDKKL
jgi:hypothetical protein